MQVYLVTGGCGSSWYYILSSTEIFTEGSQLWGQVGPLPSPSSYLAGVSVDNNIIMTGISGFRLFHY